MYLIMYLIMLIIIVFCCTCYEHEHMLSYYKVHKTILVTTRVIFQTFKTTPIEISISFIKYLLWLLSIF